MSAADLPTLNAILNATCTLLLICGFVAIRQGARQAHRRLMLSAFTVSVLFLTSYLVYHWLEGSTSFPGQGRVRPLYFGILLSHTILAAAVPFLALITLVRALRERFDAHRRIARWTLPIWIYVSVTGVVVYWMLYRVDWA